MNPFDALSDMMDTLFDALMENLVNYCFGVLAVIFALRFVSGLISGKFQVVSLAIALLTIFLAITYGQAFWIDIVRMFV